MQIRIFLAIFVVSALLSANSLWQKDSKSPYINNYDYKIGDTVTILIDENLSALQSGATKTGRTMVSGLTFDPKSDFKSDIGNRSDASKVENNMSLDSTGKSTYTGQGSTSRKTTIKTTITGTVVDIQPNGNLFVLGQRSVKINEEVENIEISGIARKADISDDNTILSSQLANSKVTIKGIGTVSNPQKPGILSRAFDWLF